MFVSIREGGWRSRPTHLSFVQLLGALVQLVDMGGKRGEVWDDKLLSEGLGEQHDVALHTPVRTRRKKRSGLYQRRKRRSAEGDNRGLG